MSRFVRFAASAVISVGLVATAAPVASATPVPAAGPAPTASPSAALPRGLFGSADPTYDGVIRQSWAIMGLASAGAEVPRSAVRWLLGQQCDNGGFEAFRANVSAPCSPGDSASYSGIDADSTSMAAIALHAAGERQAAREAYRWLLRHQFASGGWAWIHGLNPSATSTGLAMTAIRTVAAGDRARSAMRDGKQFLKTLATGCDAPTAIKGSLRYDRQAPSPDPMSTSQALLGLTTELPPLGDRTPITTGCAQVMAGAVHGGRRTLERHDGRIPDAYTPGATDWNSTALTVLALSQTKGSGEAVALGTAALNANRNAYIVKDGADRPAALGTLLTLATATDGLNARQLERRLLATLQR